MKKLGYLSSMIISLIQSYLMYYFTVNQIQIGLTGLLVWCNVSSVILLMIFVLAIYSVIKVCTIDVIKSQYVAMEYTIMKNVIAGIIQVGSAIFFVYNGYVWSCVLYILMLSVMYTYRYIVYSIVKGESE